jgi:hypothetical protein
MSNAPWKEKLKEYCDLDPQGHAIHRKKKATNWTDIRREFCVGTIYRMKIGRGGGREMLLVSANT